MYNYRGAVFVGHHGAGAPTKSNFEKKKVLMTVKTPCIAVKQPGVTWTIVGRPWNVVTIINAHI